MVKIRSFLGIFRRTFNRFRVHFSADADGLVLSKGKGVAHGVRFKLDLLSQWEHGYCRGGYEEDVLMKVRDIVQPGWVIWECGTFVGYYTCLFAKWVGPRGRVEAFELNPYYKERTERNLEINGFTNSRVHSLGIGGETGRMSVVLQRSTNSHLPGTFVGDEPGAEEVAANATAEVITLDDLSERSDIPAPNLIKIDIDGSEAFALPKMRVMALKYRPLILLELHNAICDRAAWEFSQDTGYAITDAVTGRKVAAASEVHGTLLMHPPSVPA